MLQNCGLTASGDSHLEESLGRQQGLREGQRPLKASEWLMNAGGVSQDDAEYFEVSGR